MIIKRKLFSNKEDDNKKNLAIGAGAAGTGGVLLAKTRKGHLTGKVTRYHDTNTENIKNILNEGLKASKANDPNNFTNTLLNDVDMSKKKDLIYTAKKKKLAFEVGAKRTGEIPTDTYRFFKRAKKHKVLKLEFDYDQIKNNPRITNPELRGAKNGDEFLYKIREKVLKDRGLNKDQIRHQLNMLQNQPSERQKTIFKEAFNDLNEGTHIFKGNIDSSHIVGGKGYHKRTLKQIGKYIKNNPKRFGKEAIKGAAGAALLGYGAKKLYDHYKKDKDDNTKK